jgi:hypothetical protein
MRPVHEAVVRKSSELLVRGAPAPAIDLLHTLPEPVRDRRVHLLLGDAYRITGNFASALAAYREAGGPAEAAVAWRVGQIHHGPGRPPADVSRPGPPGRRSRRG